MKPQAIRQFDFLYLGGYAVAIIGSFLGIGTAQRAMAAAGLPSGGGPIIYGSIVFSIVIALLLWYFISVRHSNVAKWIAVVLVLLGLLSEIRSLTAPAAVINGVSLAPSKTALLVGLVGIILEGVGLSRLFSPEGKAWFLPATAGTVRSADTVYPAQGYGEQPISPPQPPYPPQR